MAIEKDVGVMPKEKCIMSSAGVELDSCTYGQRILLVDDETDIITVYRKALKLGGFEVDGYDDPELALSNFKPEAYDLIILDIRMPKMNGFELCREIRKRDNKVKICFMTAFDSSYGV